MADPSPPSPPSLLTTMTAITAKSKGVLQVSHDRPLPPLLPRTMLVRVHAVAINPSDAKMAEYSFVQDGISGYDLSGEVVAIAEGVNDDEEETATSQDPAPTPNSEEPAPATDNSNSTPKKPKRKWSIGDRLWAGVHGMNRADSGTNGAFAEFARVDPVCCVRIPWKRSNNSSDSTLPPEPGDSNTLYTTNMDTTAPGTEATSIRMYVEPLSMVQYAALATSFTTAALMLWRSLRVWERPLGDGPIKPGGEKEFENVNKGEYILIYGGSTATGTMALQLAKIAGLHPLALSSPKHHRLLHTYGSRYSLSHLTPLPLLSPQIHQYTSNTLRFALDCVSLEPSMTTCYACLGRAGGAYSAVEPYPDRFRTRKAVRDDWVMALSVHGKKVELDGVYGRSEEAAKGDYEWAKGLYERAEGWVADGRLRPHPVEEVKGWEGVLEGIYRVHMGEVKGKKLVCRVYKPKGEDEE